MKPKTGSVGVFTTDRELVVQSWDPWMVEATGLAESSACGHAIQDLFPEIAQRGLLARLRRVADGEGVDVLAPAFHKYLLPCAPRDKTSRYERMRQHVTIAPLRSREGVAGVVVTLEDVTERLDRERRLAADLDSQDEAVRLRAARTLAAEGDAPGLLADSLGDASWRVRRVAVEGMAKGGGQEAVDTLITAVREHHRDAALLNSAISALAESREDVVPLVVPLLDSPEAEVRTYAALSLGLMNDSRAVPALLARLSDDDVNVRFHAIEALGRIQDRDAADPIAAVAESRDFFLAFAALDALALIGESSVAPRIMPLLEDPLLLPAAAACVGALGGEDVAIPLANLMLAPDAPVAVLALALADVYERMERDFGEGQLVADLVAGTLSEDAARRMLDALASAAPEELRGLVLVLSWLPFDPIDPALAGLLGVESVRSLVADRLGRRGTAAAALVEEAARDQSDGVRKVAAMALGRIGSERSVPTLVSWLADEEPDVVVAAAGALAAIGSRAAFEPLLEVLDHPEASVRQAAVAALNSIGHPELERAVRPLLQHESPRVRESAARIAGYFGYAQCLDGMIALCADPDETVRRAAVEHLANYDESSAWSVIHSSATNDTAATVRAAAARALGQSTSAPALRGLIAACQDANLWVRYYAARSLARRGLPHADVLATLAERATLDSAAPVRIAAIDALGALAAPSMVNVLIPLTREREPEVACAAIGALGSFDVDVTAKALVFALNDEDTARQHAALDALGRQGAVHAVGSVRTIARMTRDPALRDHAIRTLGKMGSRASTDALVALAGDRRVRSVIVEALAGTTESQLPWLAAELGDATESARCIVVEALGRMRFPAVGRVLAGLLEDPSPLVRIAAARALGRLDLRDAREGLDVMARTDSHPAARSAAQDALARR